MPSHEIVGILLVTAGVSLLTFSLLKLGLLSYQNRKQSMGLFLAVHPVALLAWLDKDATLALVVGFVVAGVVLLLLAGRQPLNGR